MRRARPARAFSIALFAGALAISGGQASADLGSDAERLLLVWAASGHVRKLAPRLLERGEAIPIVPPPELLDFAEPGCLSIAILGTTSMQFVLDPGRGQGLRPEADWPESSLGGAIAVTRCGLARRSLTTTVLEMRSPRGVLETLVLASETPPPALTRVLGHRDPGPMAPQRGPGPRPAVLPRALRLQAIEQRAAQAGATEVTAHELTATAFGVGTELLTLGQGCHELNLLAGDPATPALRSLDVDFEVTRADDGEQLVSDASESTDPSALFCIGEPAPVALRFAGAPPGSTLTLLRARWELAKGLPERWPAPARAQMSAVLLGERLGLSGATLVDEALGVQGDTLMPIEVEPGACYLAVVVRLRGDDSSLSMAAYGEGREQRTRAVELGAALGFCAGLSRTTRLEVSARGLGLTWMSAVFRTATTRLGEATP